MIQPALSDDAILASIAAPPDSADDLRLWWLGQSGFLLKFRGTSFLLDPYLSDALTKKYAATDKPHVRMTARVIAPERLHDIRVVTSSHAHTDHLDTETLIPLRKSNPGMQLVIPEANRQLVAERLGIDPIEPIGLDDGLSVVVGNLEVHGIAAAHNDLSQDASGHHPFLGYVICCGPWQIYHSGDTLLYPGLADRLRHFAIDVALLPINGNDPVRRVAGNLNGEEAAALAKEIKARRVIPCHYDMFQFNTADPADQFVPACLRLDQPFAILRAGEPWSLSVDGR
jgi:L-ascorbate metabolism protein UlaG (beta-lactamase superfamily)